jgi:PAS domain S-box-containing protein
VEAAPAEQRRLLEPLIDRVSVALFIMDEQQQCRCMNPAAEQLTGYAFARFAETPGRSLHDIAHQAKPDGRPYPLAESLFDRASFDRNQKQGEEMLVHTNGHSYPIAFTASPMCNQAGKPVGAIIEVYEVTKRHQTEHELREAQARLQHRNLELEQAVHEKTVELRRSQESLRALAGELNLAEQRERKRLATELHDHLQQMLVVGRLTIGQGQRVAKGMPACETALKKVDDILSDALTYSRTLVADLTPPVSCHHGLAASLKWLAEYMKRKHEQTVAVVVPDDQGLTLPEGQRVMLFQSVRELLINSAKHAGTGQATLTMEQRADYLCITVRDEGTGFDLAAAAAAETPSGGLSSKFGLSSIQERMRALGGSFTIDSAPEHGTRATLVLPLTKSAETVNWFISSSSPGMPAQMTPVPMRKDG